MHGELTKPENKKTSIEQLMGLLKSQDPRLNPTWVPDLPKIFSDRGLSYVDADVHTTPPHWAYLAAQLADDAEVVVDTALLIVGAVTGVGVAVGLTEVDNVVEVVDEGGAALLEVKVLLAGALLLNEDALLPPEPLPVLTLFVMEPLST